MGACITICTANPTKMVEATTYVCISPSIKIPYISVMARPYPQPEVDFKDKNKNKGVIVKLSLGFEQNSFGKV